MDTGWGDRGGGGMGAGCVGWLAAVAGGRGGPVGGVNMQEPWKNIV